MQGHSNWSGQSGFSQTTFCHGKNKIQQVINRKARLGLFFTLLGLLYNSKVNRKAASSVGKFSAANTHYLF